MATKKATEKEINRFRSLFPHSIKVRAERSEDGGYFAMISSFPGCITEADSFSELIEMVNDAVRAYLEVPLQYYSFMPTYLPPIEAVQRFDLFPVRKQEREVDVEFELASRNHAEVAC